MRAFFVLSSLILVATGCAQRLDDYETRLSDLDERTRILESSSGMPVGSDRQLLEGQRLADVRSQLSAVSNDITVIKGELEAIKFENEALKGRMDNIVREVSSTLEEVKEAAYIKGKSSASNVQTDYDIALRAHQDGDFSKARQLFESFLLKYPKHSLSDNALYWMGDSYIIEKSYKRAIGKFQDLIEKYPKSDKRCDAIGRQITALDALGMKKEAKAFTQVRDAECKSKKQ